MTGEGSGHAAWRPPAPSPSTGSTESLAGYSDLREIGVGGDSVVYRAVEDTLRRDVAIKVLDVVDEVRAARFAREVEITLDLGRQHPNIVTVLATGITGSGRPAIVMEFYPGGTLHDRLTDLGPLPVEEVVRIGLVLADALSFAHDRGVLHRDVKPQNVLVLPTSWVLADFGIARLVDSEHTGSVATFTYRHASPQVLDGHRPTAADDIWSLGSTLFTLVDGRPPFASDDPDEDSALAYLRRARTEEPRPLRVPGADALAEVIGRCLAKDPADRWSSAAEVQDVLLGLRHRGWEPTAAPAPGAPATPDVASDDLPQEPAAADLTGRAWAPTVAPASGSDVSRSADHTTPRRAHAPDLTGDGDRIDADRPEGAPAPVALSAAGHVPTVPPVDTEPTGMGLPEDQVLAGPDREGVNAEAAPARSRRRLVLALGAAALLIGTALGVTGAILRHDDVESPVQAEDPLAGHPIPELPQEPEDNDPKIQIFDPDLAFQLRNLTYDEGSLELSWEDPTEGDATFVLTQIVPFKDPLTEFDYGDTAGRFATQLSPGRTCYILILHTYDGRLGRSSNERCITIDGG